MLANGVLHKNRSPIRRLWSRRILEVRRGPGVQRGRLVSHLMRKQTVRRRLT